MPGGRADTVGVCGGVLLSVPCGCWGVAVARWWCALLDQMDCFAEVCAFLVGVVRDWDTPGLIVLPDVWPQRV